MDRSTRITLIHQQIAAAAHVVPTQPEAALLLPGWDAAFARAAVQVPPPAPTWAAAFARTSGQGA